MKKDSTVHRTSVRARTGGRWARVAVVIGTLLGLTAVGFTARGGPACNDAADRPAWKERGQHTLAVIGQVDGSFVILDSTDGAHAENLLDLECSNP